MTIPPPTSLSSLVSWKWSLLFIVTALVELYLLSGFCELYGLFGTVTFVLLSMVLGFSLMRWEGGRCWARIMFLAANGRPSTEEMKNGILIIFGGILMIFPGIVTDIIGLALFFPPTRALIRMLFLRKMFFEIPEGMNSQFQYFHFGNFPGDSDSYRGSEPTDSESPYCNQSGSTLPPDVQIIDVEVKKSEEDSPEEEKK